MRRCKGSKQCLPPRIRIMRAKALTGAESCSGALGCGAAPRTLRKLGVHDCTHPGLLPVERRQAVHREAVGRGELSEPGRLCLKRAAACDRIFAGTPQICSETLALRGQCAAAGSNLNGHGDKRNPRAVDRDHGTCQDWPNGYNLVRLRRLTCAPSILRNLCIAQPGMAMELRNAGHGRLPRRDAPIKPDRRLAMAERR